MKENILQFHAQAENQFYLLNHPQRKLYLYLQVKGKRHETAAERLPLNLSLVIDKSGSMHGDKLDNVKKAMEFVIQQLRPEDNLSIVTYDSNVAVLSPSAPLRKKEELLRKVRALGAGSTTNLSGGMLEGYAQVARTRKDGCVDRALLLSDGLANAGVTDPQLLQQMAQNKFREERTALSTFGVGADYNEDLMTNLAEYGGGNYYFIETADKIPEMFATELQGLLTVIAQRAQLSVQFPAGLSPNRVLGYPHRVEGDLVKVDFSDIFSEEEKAVVIEFDMVGEPTEVLNLDATLQYEDVIETLGRVEDRLQVQLSPTADASAFKSGLNASALDNIAQFVGNDLLTRAISAMDKRQTDQAKALLTELKVYMEGVFRVNPPSDALKALYEMGLEYEEKMEELANMPAREAQMTQKMYKSSTYMQRKRRR